MARYKIIRNIHGYSMPRYGWSSNWYCIATGLTLDEAQKHCQDPETSSKTCQKPHNKRRTRERGPWFDSYTEE